MNFKNFLTNDKQLHESHFIGEPRPVVIGYGTLSPLHIGYLPMISEMLKLSDRYEADAVLTVVQTTESDAELAQSIRVLQLQYGFLKIVTERNLMQSVIDMHSRQEQPVAILGDPVLVDKVLASCKVVFGEASQIDRAPGYLTDIQQMCEQAVFDDDFNTFSSYSMITNAAQLMNTFAHLKETYGQQQSV